MEFQVVFMGETFFSWTFPVARTYFFLFHAFENGINVDMQDYANARFFQCNTLYFFIYGQRKRNPNAAVFNLSFLHMVRFLLTFY